MSTNSSITIPFNKAHVSGKEHAYIQEAVASGDISGNQAFTQKCHSFFEQRYGFRKVLLTTSCTDALEMAAMLCGIEAGDEVIVPSYTFVTSALAFVRQGAHIRFVDSRPDHPGLDESALEALITPRTKAIVVVHYAGVACDMDQVMEIANRHNLWVVEDGAQAIDSYYKGRPLGGIGHLGTFSFHSTKNISSGEGGLLIVNDERLVERAEIIWEKGTNRAAFFRGEVSQYGWIDTGSSFLPSDIVAAYLYAQLEELESIQERRKAIWQGYLAGLSALAEQGYFRIPYLPDYATNNANMFYLVCNSPEERTALIAHLKAKSILAVFHYLPLHLSEYYQKKHDQRELPYSIMYADRLLRLPFYYSLETKELDLIIETVTNFFEKKG